MNASRSTTVITLIAVIAALAVARSFFVPLFLAAFLAFLLAPVVRFLERRLRLPAALAVIVAIVAGVGVLGGIGYAVTTEIADVVEQLPAYRANFDRRLEMLAGVKRRIESVTGDIDDIKARVAGDEGEAKEGKPSGEAEAIPVQVVEQRSPRFERLVGAYVSPIVGFLVTFAVVLVFAPFLLLARKSLRDRLVLLLRAENVYLTERAVDEATGRVSAYLLTTVVVNLAYGVPMAIGLYFIGLSHALLWGLSATLLRFIPYVGPWTAALLTIGVAAVIFPDWERLYLVVGLIVVLEFLTGNFLEPWLYGKRTGLSTLGVLVMAFFWSWLWGIAGLFLAVPISLCLVVVGRYVPSLGFFHVLLCRTGASERHTPFFQRLVVGDSEGARQFAQLHLESSGWTSLADHDFLPALRLAEEELREGTLDERRAEFVASEVARLAEDMAPEPAGVAQDSPRLQVVLPDEESTFDRCHARVVAAGARVAGFMATVGAPEPGAVAVYVAEVGTAEETSARVPGAILAARRAGIPASEERTGEPSFTNLLSRIREASTQPPDGGSAQRDPNEEETTCVPRRHPRAKSTR